MSAPKAGRCRKLFSRWHRAAGRPEVSRSRDIAENIRGYSSSKEQRASRFDRVGCVIQLLLPGCGITQPSIGERCNALAPHFRKQQRRATTIMTQKITSLPLSLLLLPLFRQPASPSLSISAKARKREARVVMPHRQSYHQGLVSQKKMLSANALAACFLLKVHLLTVHPI